MSSAQRPLRTRFVLLGVAAVSAAALWWGLSASRDEREFEELQAAGALRIGILGGPQIDGLPRRDSVLRRERAALDAFAREHRLTPRFREFAEVTPLLRALHRGELDLAAGNLHRTPEREREFLTTAPLQQTRAVLVSQQGSPLRTTDDLANRLLAIGSNSGFLRNARALQQQAPSLTLVERAADALTLARLVADGAFDCTMLGENQLREDPVLQQRLQVVTTFPEPVQIVWLLQPRDRSLRKELNRFLEERPELFTPAAQVADLPEIRRRNLLRVLIDNQPPFYYLDDDRAIGFEYELVRHLAEELGVNLAVVVPASNSDLLTALRTGQGDLVASGCAMHPVRGIRFTAPYLGVYEVIAHRRERAALRSLGELRGCSFGLLPESFARPMLEKQFGAAVKAGAPGVGVLELLQQLEDGEFDLVLAEDLPVRAKMQAGQLTYSLRLGKRKYWAWAVRENNPELRQAANAFLSRFVQTPEFRALCERYFGLQPRPDAGTTGQDDEAAGEVFRISPYDELIRKLTPPEFDWRLIAAQVFQESRFQAEAVGPDGSLGLMQLMPVLQQEFELEEIPLEPEENLAVGIAYLRKQYHRLEDTIAPEDRIAFALAAYNGGYGHLLDARALARELGLDPDRWTGQVERAYLLLLRREYHQRAHCGACRGDLIVRYVNAILARYREYQAATEQRQPAPATPPEPTAPEAVVELAPEPIRTGLPFEDSLF